MNFWVVAKATAAVVVGIGSAVITIAEHKLPDKLGDAIRDGFKMLSKAKNK